MFELDADDLKEVNNIFKYSMHGPYLDRALVYCLVKYVPGMKLELTPEIYNELMEGYQNLETHFCIGDDGNSYTAELRIIGDEPHREDEKEN